MAACVEQARQARDRAHALVARCGAVRDRAAALRGDYVRRRHAVVNTLLLVSTRLQGRSGPAPASTPRARTEGDLRASIETVHRLRAGCAAMIQRIQAVKRAGPNRADIERIRQRGAAIRYRFMVRRRLQTQQQHTH
jgi:hypothetical protein